MRCEHRLVATVFSAFSVPCHSASTFLDGCDGVNGPDTGSNTGPDIGSNIGPDIGSNIGGVLSLVGLLSLGGLFERWWGVCTLGRAFGRFSAPIDLMTMCGRCAVRRAPTLRATPRESRG